MLECFRVNSPFEGWGDLDETSQRKIALDFENEDGVLRWSYLDDKTWRTE